MSETTPEILRQALEIHSAYLSKQISDRKAAILREEKYIEVLQSNLAKLEEESEKLQRSIRSSENRLKNARNALRLGNEAQTLQNAVSTSHISPIQFHRDLATIDRGIDRAKSVISEVVPKIQQDNPRQIELQAQIESTRKTAEDSIEKMAKDEEWLSQMEPLLMRLNELISTFENMQSE